MSPRRKVGKTWGSLGDVSADRMAICAWAIVGSVSPSDRAFNDLAIKVTVEPANRARPLAARSKWETLPQPVRDRPAAEVLAEKAEESTMGTDLLPAQRLAGVGRCHREVRSRLRSAAVLGVSLMGLTVDRVDCGTAVASRMSTSSLAAISASRLSSTC